MSIATEFVTATLSFVGRDDLPQINTGTTSSSSTSTSSGSSKVTAQSGTSTSTQGGMPTIVTTTSTSSSSSTQDYTTPAIGVPSAIGNPYIARTSSPSGTVFIAVGSIVAVILLGFAFFHLFKSLTASSLAKRTVNNEKKTYQNFAHNNNVAYGGGRHSSQSSFFNATEYKGSVSKLPLMSVSQSQSGFGGLGADYNTSGLSDSEIATSHQDLTNMFISPTKEMTNKRLSTHNLSNSITNLSVFGKSSTDLGHHPISNKHASTVPNYYMDDNYNNSQFSLVPDAIRNGEQGERKPRNPIPSMYLEDLIDS